MFVQLMISKSNYIRFLKIKQALDRISFIAGREFLFKNYLENINTV